MKRSSFFLILLCACASAPEPESQPPPIPVRTAPVVMNDVRTVIYTSGVTASNRQMHLSFKIGGIVDRIFAREGASVRGGDTLAVLDRTEIAARHAQAITAHEKARRDFENAQTLLADSVATRDQLLDAQAALDNAQATLDIAKHSLTHSAITAPTQGRIAKRLGEVREIVAAGQPLFAFASEINRPVLRAGVTDRDVVIIAPGDSAFVRFDAYPDEAVPAIVDIVSASADARTGLYEISLALLPGRRTLLPGMIGQAHIRTQHARRMPAVPVEALIGADADRGFVYVLADSVVHRRPVILGGLVGAQVLVQTGVMPGEQVITEGASYLSDRSRVIVLEPGQGL